MVRLMCGLGQKFARCRYAISKLRCGFCKLRIVTNRAQRRHLSIKTVVCSLCQFKLPSSFCVFQEVDVARSMLDEVDHFRRVRAGLVCVFPQM